MSDQDFLVALVRRNGAELVTSLFGLFKTLKVFALDNKSSQTVLAKFHQYAGEFLETLDTVDIQLMGSQFFVSGVKVVIGLAGFESFSRFGNELTKRGVGTISLHQGLQDEELARFAKFFMDFSPSKDDDVKPYDEFSAGLEQLGLQAISTKKFVADETVGAADDEDDSEVASYLKTIFIVKKIYEAARKNKKINFKNAKRAVQKLVGVVEDAGNDMVTLLRMADIGDYLPFHAANVAVYAVMIASRLGLPKTKAADVGVCGLFHDIGMTSVPSQILEHPGSFGREQWELIWQHPVDGAKMMLRTTRMSEVMVRAMQVAFQHQMRDDETGYPQLGTREELNLYTKIVKVADGYDELTHNRPFRKALPEERAFHDLLALSETVYDRTIVKLLANILGVYPIGATVKLNTGEIGTVQRQNPDPDYRDKPVVRVYADAYGQQIDRVVDMMEKQNGVFRYWIVPFDEQELSIDMSEFISIL